MKGFKHAQNVINISVLGFFHRPQMRQCLTHPDTLPRQLLKLRLQLLIPDSHLLPLPHLFIQPLHLFSQLHNFLGPLLALRFQLLPLLDHLLLTVLYGRFYT